MAVTHTPGPWTIGRTDFDNAGEVIEINAPDGTSVAHVLSSDEITEAERADAFLIAAAPELLEALKQMEIAAQEIAVEFIEHERATNWKVVNDAYIASARAIAKAEGK